MPHNANQQGTVRNILQNLNGIDSLKELFWAELNYDPQNDPLPRHGGNDLTGDPILFATGGSDAAFHIIYVHLNADLLSLTTERRLITQLLRNHPYALFVFSNREQTDWHLVNVKYDPDHPQKRRLFRRITISPHEKLRTASERVAMLDLESISSNIQTIPPFDIQKHHEEAFNVEAVTKRFFDDYKIIFHALQDDLTSQTQDSRWAHDYALQFLNRCMFLYFIQRKGWLGEDTGFLRTFWESYQKVGVPPDSFVEDWLNVLFFEAFNNRFHGGHRHFPDAIRKALGLAPYLNGGLFSENNLDAAHDFRISDSRFTGIFEFLENYNFTIAEDSPFDQEVAVDPEMIGKVYESLVNVSPETDERGDAGIFYTPRTEIDLMCRLALVDNLANHLGETRKNLLYEAVFAFNPDDKAEADGKLREKRLWAPLDECLKAIAIVDPACGSGAFLVGMLHILDDLRHRANRALGVDELSFDRKKAIIGGNLYGVDVMEWACHVAELRLWLALIIDADFPRAELHLRNEPLLPHFSFNIRCGDSLVQEIGGMNLATLRDAFSGVPSALKARITRLNNEKLKFFNNDPTCRYQSGVELEQEELLLFQTMMETHANDIKQQIHDLQQLIDNPKAKQMNLDGTLDKTAAEKLKLEVMETQNRIEALSEDLEHVEKAGDALVSAKRVPFVWDIAFVEIFTGEKGGFDVVIGNPPYVRQENIADPNLPRENVTTEDKKAHKARLARSVYQAFPRFFGYKREKDTSLARLPSAVSHKIDAKSDLYIYFHFHGLSLLNPKGSFCFITSNSWLDVGYGSDLQEFLLKHCHTKQIIDNQSRRSFASADVNTVICLFSAPDEKRKSGLDKTTRFVMFKTPFEGVLDAVIFEEVEEASERTSTEEHRIFPVSQQALLESGSDDQTRKYTGDKWGGKYLRAPDIYWTILEKGKGKLVRLGDVAEVRFGIKTGANDFFYLDDAKILEWGIEEEFLKPVIKSPRECKSILIDPSQLKFKLFMCNKDEATLKGTAAWKYIEYGESKGFSQRPSCSGRARWWDLGRQMSFDWLVLRFRDKRNWTPINEGKSLLAGDIVFTAALQNRDTIQSANAVANSTFAVLVSEIFGRANLGDGLLTTYGPEILRFHLISPDWIDAHIGESLSQALEPMKQREVLPIFDEIQQPDRRALDAIIFDALNLTQGERDAVYEAVIDLVETRLSKARSLLQG